MNNYIDQLDAVRKSLKLLLSETDKYSEKYVDLAMALEYIKFAKKHINSAFVHKLKSDLQQSKHWKERGVF